MRLLPLLPAAPLVLLGLAGPIALPSTSLHAASDDPPNAVAATTGHLRPSPGSAARSSASTPSATSSCGPVCCGMHEADRHASPQTGAGGRPQGRRRRAAADHSSRRCRQARSISTDPAVTLDAAARSTPSSACKGGSAAPGTLTERRHHLRALPLDRRRLAGAGHRPPARRLGQHDSRRRRHPRAVAGARSGDQGGVRDVGTGQIRSAASLLRRHGARAAEQPVAADRHPADLRAAAASASRRSAATGRSRTGTATSASARWAGTDRSAIRASASRIASSRTS